MIDGLIRWSLRHRADRRRARGRLSGVGRLDRVAHSARRAAGPDRSDGDHPRRSAGHGPAGDRVARHVSDRIGAERRRWRSARPFGNRSRRGGGVGRVRLGPGHCPRPADGHREAHARLRVAAAQRRAAIPGAGLLDHGRGSVRRSRSRTGIRRWSCGPSPRPSSVGACSRFLAFPR